MYNRKVYREKNGPRNMKDPKCRLKKESLPIH